MRGNGALDPWGKRLPIAGYPPRYGEFGHLATSLPFSLPGGLSPGVFLGVVFGVSSEVFWDPGMVLRAFYIEIQKKQPSQELDCGVSITLMSSSCLTELPLHSPQVLRELALEASWS